MGLLPGNSRKGFNAASMEEVRISPGWTARIHVGVFPAPASSEPSAGPVRDHEPLREGPAGVRASHDHVHGRRVVH